MLLISLHRRLKVCIDPILSHHHSPRDVLALPLGSNGALSQAMPMSDNGTAPTSGPVPAAPTRGPAPAAPTHGPAPTAPTRGPVPVAPTRGPAPVAPTRGPAPTTPTRRPAPAAPTCGPVPVAPTHGPVPYAPNPGPVPTAPNCRPVPAAPTRGPIPASAPRASNLTGLREGSSPLAQTASFRPEELTARDRQDMFLLAEIMHDGLTANSDWSWREAWLQEQGMQPHDHFMFHNQTDPASRRLNMLAEAAHVGNRSKQYVEAPVRNAYGYFQRSIMPIMDEMDHCMEMRKLDGAAVDAADALLDQLDNGLI